MDSSSATMMKKISSCFSSDFESTCVEYLMVEFFLR